MNQPRDLDALIATWLDDGPVDLPDETRRAIAVGLRTQPRARQVAILGGSAMFALNRIAAAAAIVLAVVALSAFLLSNRVGGPGAAPTPFASVAPSSTPPPSPSPSIAPSSSPSSFGTAGWITFSSSRYGYDIKIPAAWTATAKQSTRQWSLKVDQYDWLTSAADSFGPDPHVTGFAVDVPAGTSNDAWIASYYGPDAKGSPDPCQHVPTDLATKQVDGHPVAFWDELPNGDCEGTSAFVFMGNRVNVFFVGRAAQHPLFEALMSTVKFRS
jgi:hypothetical protein